MRGGRAASGGGGVERQKDRVSERERGEGGRGRREGGRERKLKREEKAQRNERLTK